MGSEDGENEIIVALATFPDESVARQIATTLVEEQLAACVNLLPGAESIYRWEETVESAQEVAAILKTRRTGAEALRNRFLALHPYDVPELVFLPTAGGNPDYLAWVTTVTGSPSS